MYADKFELAFKEALYWEGGYVNHPNDPGSQTKWGISQKSYPNLDIKNLTIEQAKQIYYCDFWKKIPFEITIRPLTKIPFRNEPNTMNIDLIMP